MTSLLLCSLLLLAPAGPAEADDRGAPPPPDDSIAQHSDERGERPALRAHRIDGKITIDGHLDEPDWDAAPAAQNFTQRAPDEGAPPSQRTVVRVLYGDTGLYVGALLSDDAPDRIQDRLTRRDNRNQADWFEVSIDSRFDRQTAYTFAVNAANVQRDGLQQRRTDTSWDGIWNSAVQITPEGWVVEMHIPYSMLRFSRAETQRWGLQFRRRIPRTGERLEWAFTPRTERGGRPVAKYGLLVGLEDLSPRRNIQAFPYTVSQIDTYEGNDTGTLETDRRVDAGGNVRLGMGPNVTLDATINPDFGQVQADPATLNLSAFETFFKERRPFFTEGSQFFSFDQQGGNLLYTRRIGTEAPLIGATKVTGRTPGGLSVGGMTAVEGSDFSPERYYGVANLQQEFGRYSDAGGMVTIFDGSRDGQHRRAASGGANWDLRLADNTYQIRGHASATHRRRPSVSGTDATTGFSASTHLARVQGATTYRLRGRVLGDQFNPNDVGRVRRNNYVRVRGRINHEFNDGQSFGAWQRARARVKLSQSWTYRTGINGGLGHVARTTWKTRDFVRLRLRTSSDYLTGGYDVFETRGEGPRARPREFNAGIRVRTDTRRDWRIRPRLSTTHRSDGGREYDVSVRGRWDANQYLTLSGSVSYEREDDLVEWASNDTFVRSDDGWRLSDSDDRVLDASTDDLDALFAPRRSGPDEATVPVYGERDTRTFDVELNGDVTLSPTLSLELFGQLFAARGQYDRFQVLQTPDDLVPFEAYPKRHDFALSSFLANTVLRWEYRPGSELFVVWSQSRRQDLDQPFFVDAPRSSPFDAPTPNRMVDVFDVFPNNTFLVKLRYAFTS